MFRRYSLSLGRVYDRIRIKEGTEHLDLYVDADPQRMVAGLEQAQTMLKSITDETTDQERRDIALYFAGVIFGGEQAAKLFEYYHGDTNCVIMVCGRYFSERLGKKIVKQQKK